MWCVPELTKEYVEKMEDVLEVYEKPLNPKEPVVWLDERPIQMLDDAREPIRVKKPGDILKGDSEYVRKGTANAFCAVEPKTGKHLTRITENRKMPEFAKMVSRINKAYPEAETIHLVMDNLNTHFEKSLTNFYGEEQGKELWSRFTPLLVKPTLLRLHLIKASLKNLFREIQTVIFGEEAGLPTDPFHDFLAVFFGTGILVPAITVGKEVEVAKGVKGFA